MPTTDTPYLHPRATGEKQQASEVQGVRNNEAGCMSMSACSQWTHQVQPSLLPVQAYSTRFCQPEAQLCARCQCHIANLLGGGLQASQLNQTRVGGGHSGLSCATQRPHSEHVLMPV